MAVSSIRTEPVRRIRGVRTESATQYTESVRSLQPNTRSPYGNTRSPYGAMTGKSRTPYGLKVSHRGLRGVSDESTTESRGHLDSGSGRFGGEEKRPGAICSRMREKLP